MGVSDINSFLLFLRPEGANINCMIYENKALEYINDFSFAGTSLGTLQQPNGSVPVV